MNAKYKVTLTKTYVTQLEIEAQSEISACLEAEDMVKRTPEQINWTDDGIEAIGAEQIENMPIIVYNPTTTETINWECLTDAEAEELVKKAIRSEAFKLSPEEEKGFIKKYFAAQEWDDGIMMTGCSEEEIKDFLYKEILNND